MCTFFSRTGSLATAAPLRCEGIRPLFTLHLYPRNENNCVFVYAGYDLCVAAVRVADFDERLYRFALRIFYENER